ncbi:MAG: carboxymuconolactone decarboxylase family protein [Mesorhizobium sp.]|uniref:carboxymuconolactone decarboxylase family protein n=1 Tax=unclassified Mesorhizobium TaxID=325217 RepID=UPI000F761404|nr:MULTISPECIES: carboxymuconolactone decarboxylase family protein [unclassified Mesorhizobium]RVC71342.1 carboxymuconolactone decarboxylase family protein [Mesorhizobium sp. M2A.F.Ca.ET.046.02.1.1]AZO33590.1 carboxymuconolactone decarboxylase family protein [Mesorhizobium sp. M2A.F.Ca.ET.046.03.2.1]RWB38758.1 MAG: carboxymuconolactone decarboxylase family protein [Mesorhizobium sp.]RWE22210.1 MAG: carboxymuconolactone decarboxylase family protein [Mesorhizobium sp.]RWE38302.1 MAG: carboxymuco
MPTPIDRPPALDENLLTPEQAHVYKAIKAGPRGVVEGPLRVWLQSPELADKAQELGAFCRYGTVLGPRLSELAILLTGAHWRAGFEWVIHAAIAERAGIDAAVIDAIRLGKEPSFGDAAERVVYRFATELHRTMNVSDNTYRESLRLLGTRGTVELVGILGYYGFISMTIKTFHVPLPEGAPDPFA